MLSVPSRYTFHFQAAVASSPEPRPPVLPTPTDAAAQVSVREAAMDELISLIRRTPLPASGKLVSEPRARAAALVLIRALRNDSLDLSETSLTVCRLVQSGGYGIMPLLNDLCKMETGHGIRKVQLDRVLTALLQAEEPSGILGLQGLGALDEVMLTPVNGELDLRLLPIARCFVLNMDDSQTCLTVHAYIGQCLESTWPAEPVEPSIVNRYSMLSETFLVSIPLVYRVESVFELLPRIGDSAPAARLTEQAQQPSSLSSILGFMRRREEPMPPAQAVAGPQQAARDRAVKLVDRAYPNVACWLKVTDAGMIDAAFLEEPDSGRPEQAVYRINVTVDEFESALGDWMDQQGVPLAQLLDRLSASPTDLEGFSLWLHGEFHLTNHRDMERSLANP